MGAVLPLAYVRVVKYDEPGPEGYCHCRCIWVGPDPVPRRQSGDVGIPLPCRLASGGRADDAVSDA